MLCCGGSLSERKNKKVGGHERRMAATSARPAFRIQDLDRLSIVDLQAKKKAMGESSPTDGSRPKQLPPTPDQPSASQSSPPRANTPAGPQQSYGTFLTEYSLMAEYNVLMKKRIPGVYAIPSYKSPLVWFGVLFIRQGLYQEGVFKFTVYIPDNYPDSDCPRLVFDHVIFHPAIHPETGELDVAKAFPKWRKGVNHLWEVLMYARRIFHKVETKDSSNTEAGSLYDKDLPGYRDKVTETVQMCKNLLYDPPVMDDPYAIRFSEWEPEIHEEAQRKMLSVKERTMSASGLPKNTQRASGLSWLKQTHIIPPDENGKS